MTLRHQGGANRKGWGDEGRALLILSGAVFQGPEVADAGMGLVVEVATSVRLEALAVAQRLAKPGGDGEVSLHNLHHPSQPFTSGQQQQQ